MRLTIANSNPGCIKEAPVDHIMKICTPIGSVSGMYKHVRGNVKYKHRLELYEEKKKKHTYFFSNQLKPII